ncbi:SLC13 family permease [Fontisphaera persica]|uniref:GntP family permease n=1 Tax=Fontisphaera persica TaxID=2974023 RepID=UPI0024BF5756|nr:SLC13 family permease [Fontisphaera persica]WCJ59333.1 SLC13 family permease [Fontisphaera persica]
MTVLLAQTAAAPAPGLWPLAVLGISVGLIIVLITRLRVHPFLALIAAAMTAGLLAERLPGARPRGAPPPLPAAAATDGAQPAKPPPSHWVAAVELTTREFGNTAGKIAIVIGLASIIGMCLMESGAADKVVRRFLAVFGEKHVSFALLGATYFLSIPIFFDTMFMLMVPLAKALRLRTGKDYLLYVMAICSGGMVTHSLTVPHPGPLAMVDNLKVDVGMSIVVGVLVGILPAIVGWWAARWINGRMEVPLRETPDAPLAELETIVAKPESELPPFWLAVMPVILPIALISGASFFEVAGGSFPALVTWMGAERFAQIHQWVEFIGNRNVALGMGAVIALGILAWQRGFGFRDIEERLGAPMLTAGVIILITSAGGAYGLMLKNAGVGDAVKELVAGKNVNLIFLAWLVAWVIRVAQGSATVAMLTASAMVYPMMDPATNPPLPYHPLYIFCAIGFGALSTSWMNDSGFWVVSRLSGMTETETLKSWTVMSTIIAITGLLLTWLLAKLLPFAPQAMAAG